MNWWYENYLIDRKGHVAFKVQVATVALDEVTFLLFLTFINTKNLIEYKTIA